MDSYTTTTYRGLGDNLMSSIGGMIGGIILFVIAFPLLWWNEGRIDLSTVAKTATVIAADGAQPAPPDKLVSITGDLAVDGKLGDPGFLPPGAYVQLAREVETWAWVEHEKSREEKQLGGGTKTITTYTYELEWTRHPKDASHFKVPEGHQNPKPRLEDERWFAPTATVGVYSFLPAKIELPPSTAVGPEYQFRGKGTLDTPRIGDARIAFRAVTDGQLVTLYGEARGHAVLPYSNGDARLFRVVAGTHAQAIATMHGEHVVLTWVLRAVGFLMMWFGLALTLGPINTFLDIIPFIGSAGRFITGLVMFPVALVLSGVVILLSIVAHSPILLAVVLLAIVAGTVVLIMRRSAQKKAAAGPA